MEVSVTGYPEVLRRELQIDDNMLILVGLAIGYEDPDFPANHLRVVRESVANHVVFLCVATEG